MTKYEEPVRLEGTSFYTVKQFAKLTERGIKSVYQLISAGNSQRKLRTVKLAGCTLVYAAELTEFPFTRKNSGAVYHYKIRDKETVV